MARSGKSPAQSSAQGDEMGQSRPPLTEDLLKRLYANMLKCRMVQEQLRLAGASPSTAGLEATIVGATIDLRSEDAIAPSRNSLFAHVIHGTPLQYVFAQSACRAKKQSVEQANAQRGVDFQSGLAASLNVAAGMALTFRLQKKANVVIALSDDTASLGAWQEAMSFAGLYRLPVVFVVVNNLRDDAASDRASDIENIKLKAQACGFPIITVDGNDAVAVYRVCYEARECARQGYGPTLVESCTSRRNDPAEAEPSQPYGSEMMTQCSANDPIAAMEIYLRKQSLWDDRWKSQLVKEFKHEIRQALKSAKKPESWLPEEALKIAYSFGVAAVRR